MRSPIAVSRDTPFSFFIAKMTLTADSELFPYMRFLNVLQWLAEWFPFMLESSHRCSTCVHDTCRSLSAFLKYMVNILRFIIKVSVSKCSKNSQNFRLLHPARGHSEILCLKQLVRWSPFRRQHYMLYDLNSANTVRLYLWYKASATRCKWNFRPCGMLRSFDW